MSVIQTHDGDYEEVADEVRIAIQYLLKIRDRMGITDESKLDGSIGNAKHQNITIRKYALEIYKVWASLYPREHRQFIENTKDDLMYERPVQDAIKAGGYSPTSYPTRLTQLFDILIPGVKIQDKRFWKPLFNEIPELRRSNYA